jgi:hypothetical protein
MRFTICARFWYILPAFPKHSTTMNTNNSTVDCTTAITREQESTAARATELDSELHTLWTQHDSLITNGGVKDDDKEEELAVYLKIYETRLAIMVNQSHGAWAVYTLDPSKKNLFAVRWYDHAVMQAHQELVNITGSKRCVQW